MCVKQILARLRKERTALEEAISALEKIPTRSLRKASRTKLARESAALPQLAATNKSIADAQYNAKIIEFPRSRHTA